MAQTNPFELLTAEHDILRRRLGRVLRASEDVLESNEGRRATEAFLSALRLHIRREERALFPLCARLFGGRESAISVLEDDHEAIGGAAASLARASATAKLDRDRVRELVRLLETHFTREEKVLFPVAETRMTAAEATFLARRLRTESSP
ncbi:MAG: hypothetical protein A3K68_06905 [Euryarchaeota archaeon RBG_16_68_13]|nr:MAG: hypothetical protein A3K68_06905 [Euryarchaeota archaeon RBG_16_68_13]